MDVVGLRATQLQEGGYIEVQLIGEFGESGALPIYIPATNGHSKEQRSQINFKLQSVALGRVRHVTVTFPVVEDGTPIFCYLTIEKTESQKSAIRVGMNKWEKEQEKNASR